MSRVTLPEPRGEWEEPDWVVREVVSRAVEHLPSGTSFPEGASDGASFSLADLDPGRTAVLLAALGQGAQEYCWRIRSQTDHRDEWGERLAAAVAELVRRCG